MKNINILYKGYVYSNNKGKIRSIMNTYDVSNYRTINVIDAGHNYVLGTELEHLFTLYENDEFIELTKNTITLTEDFEVKIDKNVFKVNKDEIANEDFIEKYQDKIDLIEKDIRSGIFSKNSSFRLAESDSKNTELMLEFLLSIMVIKRPYLCELFDEELTNLIVAEYKNKGQKFIDSLLINIFNALFYNYSGFEKILKTNKNIIVSTIGRSEINLENEGKINKVINLPKFVIDYVNDKKYESLAAALQKLDIDGNSYRILLDFFDNSSVLVASNKREETFTEFTNIIAEIMTYDEYNLKDLLNHLIKETFYYPPFTLEINHYYSFNRSDTAKFEFPLAHAHTMLDYLKMAKRNNVEHKKYPRILLDHNVTMKNLTSLDHIDEEEFKNIVKEYSVMTENFNHKVYDVIVPEDLHDMIKEGNELSHCVASYATDIMEGNSKIFFLREKENLNKSFVTIEVNESNELNHIRGAFNVEPDVGIINLVKSWLKRN